MGLLLLLSAASGFYLLATDNSLWRLALSHAYGLIAIVIVDIILGLMNLASSRGAYLPGLAAAVLATALAVRAVGESTLYGGGTVDPVAALAKWNPVGYQVEDDRAMRFAEKS